MTEESVKILMTMIQPGIIILLLCTTMFYWPVLNILFNTVHRNTVQNLVDSVQIAFWKANLYMHDVMHELSKN